MKVWYDDESESVRRVAIGVRVNMNLSVQGAVAYIEEIWICKVGRASASAMTGGGEGGGGCVQSSVSGDREYIIECDSPSRGRVSAPHEPL